MPPDPEKEPKRSTSDTKDAMDNLIDNMKAAGKIKKLKGLRSGKPTWASSSCKPKEVKYYQKSKEGWEIEVYNYKGKHIGVLKSDGKFHPEMAVEGRSINVR